MSIDQQLLDLEFLHITYHSKKVGGKVSTELNADVKKCINIDDGDEKHHMLYCNAPDT